MKIAFFGFKLSVFLKKLTCRSSERLKTVLTHFKIDILIEFTLLRVEILIPFSELLSNIRLRWLLELNSYIHFSIFKTANLLRIKRAKNESCLF